MGPTFSSSHPRPFPRLSHTSVIQQVPRQAEFPKPGARVACQHLGQSPDKVSGDQTPGLTLVLGSQLLPTARTPLLKPLLSPLPPQATGLQHQLLQVGRLTHHVQNLFQDLKALRTRGEAQWAAPWPPHPRPLLAPTLAPASRPHRRDTGTTGCRTGQPHSAPGPCVGEGAGAGLRVLQPDLKPSIPLHGEAQESGSWHPPPFPVLAGHTPTAQVAEVSEAEMAAALTMVDGVHILEEESVSNWLGAARSREGLNAHGEEMSPEPPREGPTLTH